MYKVLITGSLGQLGRELSVLLPDAVLTDKDTLDITNEEAVLNFVHQNHIGIIINCAAYTAVDKAEEEEEAARAVNEIGAQNLAKTGCRIIHISTDYVFDGLSSRPYRSQDETNPLSVYGKTKRAGEKAVLKYAKEAVIIRTAWLYSPYGNNFVKTMQKLGTEQDVVNVVTDQIGTPTYAADLAEAVIKILPQVNEKTTGIYHFTNEGVCSWYDFACEIMEIFHLNCQVNPILSAAYPTKAKRPFYSVLDKTQIKETFGFKIPHWKDGLRRYLKETMEKV